MSIKIPDSNGKMKERFVFMLFFAVLRNVSVRLNLTAIGFLSCLLIPILTTGELFAGEKTEMEIIKRADQLPVGVRAMHRAILQAAMSGQVENLREVLQMNELMPLIDGKFVHDPIAHWKAASKDHSGREVMALLTELLELPPVKKTTKSGTLYIWPYFTGIPLEKLNPPQLVRLYRLAPAEKIALMLKDNRYSHGYVTIGADGTWHSFGHSFEQAF